MDSKKVEAERRIEEAVRTGAEWLDLGDLALDELPARIGELKNLRGLALGWQTFTKAKILELGTNRYAPKFVDLTPLAMLVKLEVLSLFACQWVTDLSPLSSLINLQRLSLCLTLKPDLSCLQSLTSLRRLDLENSGVEDFAPLASLIGLQSLSLNRTRVTDLSPLAHLIGLQSLSFNETSVADLSPLASLWDLKTLNLEKTGATDLSPLASLSDLQSLSFDETRVTDLSPLASLSALQNLSFYGTRVKDLSPLASLTGLQNLSFGGTQVKDLSPLASLTGLQSLNFGGTQVKDLSPLASLTGLQSLRFNGTEVMDLSPLVPLGKLQNLWFRLSHVTDLSPLASLSSLRVLDLSCTRVRDLSALVSLNSLQELELVGCQVADVSPLSSLAGLKRLDLSFFSGMTRSVLRKVANFPDMQFFFCEQADGVPREVLSEGDSCLERLRAHFADLDEAAEAENEVKIILLGNGRVGKTQFCRRFRDLKPNKSIKSTHGVELSRYPLRLRFSGEEEIHQANWWDFGGQDIYHGTHALFLRSRAVFLILWTPALENRDELEENGIPLRNQQLSYWLDYVRSLAGSESPVIIVQSQCDTFGQERPLPVQPEGFDFLRSTAYSAWTDLGRETLEGQIRDAIRYLREKTGALSIGVGRAEVRRKLYEMREEDKDRASEERQHRTLTLEEFSSLCEQTGGISSPEMALDYFHQTGVVFYRSDLFSERIVLDQTWALDAVYALFDRQRAAPALRQSGKFTRRLLESLVWGKHSVDEQRLFLGLMESCGICFEHGKNYEGETEYVAPDLLPPFAAVQGKLYAWRENEPIVTLRLSYRFFHQAIIRGLMSRVGQIAGEAAEYWKYGFWLYDRKRDAQVLVQQVDTYSDKAPGAGELEIRAQGRDVQGLLRVIRRAILDQRIGERPEESLTIDGKSVARSELTHAIGGQVHTIDGGLVQAGPFIAFFAEREWKGEEPSGSEDGNRLDISPSSAPKGERPEVFISYAWGDKTVKGRQRTEIVDRLQVALAEEGFAVQRDRDSQVAGDRISHFIERLGAADRVVTVISRKYLKSFACMEEIFLIYQRCQADGNRFAESVVPIILPEIRRNSEGREPYVRYWTDKAEELDQRLKRLGRKAGEATRKEARLASALADNIDNILGFVVDILIPRNLNVPLESDFEGVKAALLRRLKP